MNLRQHIGVPEGSPIYRVDGVGLAVAREGRGPPLVCLHATGHGGGDYAALAARLGQHLELIRIDWPGQGRSEPDPAAATPERYAQLLAGLLPQLGVERPILLGNSIGGAAALLYASQHPVRALVLCNSGGLVPVSPLVRLACRAFAAFFAAGARGAGWFGAAFRAYYRWLILPSAAAATQRQRITAAAYELAPVLTSAWTGFARPEADLRTLAAGLDLPIWVAWAQQDRILALRQNLPAIRRLRRASLSRYRGGHAAFLEQPEAFVEGLLAFCRRERLITD